MTVSEDMIAIVEPMIPRLRRYARALLRDRDDADELVQDCLERAVAHWHRRRGQGSPQAWLFTILHNLALNRIRQTSRRGAHVSLEAELHDRPRQEDGLRQRDVMAALDRLPEDQRQVILLVSLEDVSYAEAAEILSVPPGTVMSRLSRGREKLRQILGEEESPVLHGLRRVK